ncbi:hypothetical protein [Pelagicoccus sp. SDUM812002]|uniref:hypothetical protein n=1 Tax=Pelagicoccus sp. SDUM812002 TaxID=3041266 RepID=UPI00280F613E|nr:hypothetical protein [Pelagicoccus sp. SDUM812002]MDQ8183963.1 hypothetical protein [Pelagicoccus sp. SDUM812002]
MKEHQKIDARSAQTLRDKQKLTDEEASYLKLKILEGDPWPSHEQMLHAWIAGAWPLLEWIARNHIQVDSSSARAYLHLAAALHQQGKSDEADLVLEQAHASCSSLEEVEYETAVILAMEGQLDEAEQHYFSSLHMMELKNPDNRPISDKKAAFQKFLRNNLLPISIKFRDSTGSEDKPTRD